MKNVPAKTNAMRLLETAGILRRIYEYETADGRIDALSIAEKIGVSPDQVFKTLVTVCSVNREHFVFVVPATAELDLKRAARAAGQKNIELIPMKQLLPLTGYVHGGCSPVGMKKTFPIYFDETAVLFDFICVSGGKVGTNVAVNPEELAELIHAEFAPLTAE